MTYDQYWYGDVDMVKAYREADKLRQERMNTEAWIRGMYIYDAISRLFPIPVGFVDKGAKPRPYIEQPYQFATREEQREEINPEELNKKKAQVRGLQARLFTSP